MGLASFLGLLDSLGAFESRSIKRQERPLSCLAYLLELFYVIWENYCKFLGAVKQSMKALLDTERSFVLSPGGGGGRTTKLASQQLFGWFFPCTEFKNNAFVNT